MGCQECLLHTSEIKRKKLNIIEFDRFIQHKEEGDAIDNEIAELLALDKIAA